MKRFLSFVFPLLLVFVFLQEAAAQLTVNGTLTPQQLVQTILIGNGISASNISYSGDPVAIGSFNSSNSNVGFQSGVLLTTGTITNAIGPNNSGNTGTDNLRPGDADLDQTVSDITQDAAVLEFDFVPASDTLRFNFVFASEEYLEWVNSGFNDVFGFFISGPGISGPFSNNATNIALIPGTNTLVSIDNVNDVQNSIFYHDNITPTPPSTALQYDGFTVPLIAEAIVQCGETYHIKLAIADAGDGTYDSGVFLEAGSFETSGVQITATATSSSDSIIVEGCGSAVFSFYRPDTSSAFTIHFNIQGTAIPGIDYSQIPDSIVIPQGQFSEQLLVDAFYDGISESMETITLTIDFITGCGSDTLKATIYLQSIDSIEVLTGEDHVICTPCETATLKASATGGYGSLTYTWSDGAGIGDSVVVSPVETTKYFVTVTDTCGNVAFSDSIEVVVQCNEIVVQTGEDLTICSPMEVATLSASATGGYGPLYFHWSNGAGDSSSVVVSPLETTRYFVTVSDTCGNYTFSDSIEVLVQCEVIVPNIFTPNGDDKNQTFFIVNLDQYPGSDLKIFNRWGRKVYHSEDYKNDWDGEKLSEGTYFYILTLSDPEKEPKTGHLTIIKD